MSAALFCPECKGSGRGAEREVYRVGPSGGSGGEDVPVVLDCEACMGAGVAICNKCGAPATSEPFPGQFFCNPCNLLGVAR